MNDRKVSCCSVVGSSGYRASIVWKYFHVARPNSALEPASSVLLEPGASLAAFRACHLLCRLIAQLWHHHFALGHIGVGQCCRLRIRDLAVRDLALTRGTDRGVRRVLRSNEEETKKYGRNHSAYQYTSSNLAIRHGERGLTGGKGERYIVNRGRLQLR